LLGQQQRWLYFQQLNSSYIQVNLQQRLPFLGFLLLFPLFFFFSCLLANPISSRIDFSVSSSGIFHLLDRVTVIVRFPSLP